MMTKEWIAFGASPGGLSSAAVTQATLSQYAVSGCFVDGQELELGPHIINTRMLLLGNDAVVFSLADVLMSKKEEELWSHIQSCTTEARRDEQPPTTLWLSEIGVAK